ncbi:hypothetical protein L6R52_35190 [Myxococcota bacterium]|nr:hypothetical protein [Myxococcota bacterium]
MVLRTSLSSLVAITALTVPATAAADPMTGPMLRPLLVSDVNAIQGNRHFVRAMIDFNSTPFTIGFSSQQAAVELLRIDGATVPGSLSKDQIVLGVGWGRPSSAASSTAGRTASVTKAPSVIRRAPALLRRSTSIRTSRR